MMCIPSHMVSRVRSRMGGILPALRDCHYLCLHYLARAGTWHGAIVGWCRHYLGGGVSWMDRWRLPPTPVFPIAGFFGTFFTKRLVALTELFDLLQRFHLPMCIWRCGSTECISTRWYSNL